MAYRITSESLGITALNDTLYDQNYFNKLFNTNDCVVTKIPDQTSEQIVEQLAQQKIDEENAKQQSELDAQIQVQRMEYIDALMSEDIEKQQSIQAQYSLLLSQKGNLK
jgi:hypothetical protein